MEKVTSVPQVSILGLSVFLIYINNLPKITDNKAKNLLFTDDTSIMVTDSNKGGLQTTLKITISDIISRFKSI
jgi:hypothetical protein